ncbi:MAG: branched-chain amino acid ABC transporter permease [Acidimicrobiaceae bacterium]|nr:branched-chain amino acid ABC transporter permease [Acidimicrobiia bacterium]MCY4492226.1 branched-chain amino acid ABC transporter permease [Acidimicrobiaceae bacterium]
MLHVLNAFSLLATLGLTALGLWIVFGLMNVVNVAHGEFAMLGAYSMVVLTGLGIGHWLAVIVTPGILFVIGAICELTVFRRLRTRREVSLLAAFGLSIVLREIVQLTFGRQQRSIPNPLRGGMEIAGVTYPKYQALVIVVAVAVLLVAWMVLRYTRVGLTMRAVVADRDLAETLGIRAARVDTVAMAVGASSAGLAGALLAPRISIEPSAGLNLLLGGFLVVIVGGFRRPSAVAVGAAAVAVITTIVALRYDAVWGQLAAVALAAVILQRRVETGARGVVQ